MADGAGLRLKKTLRFCAAGMLLAVMPVWATAQQATLLADAHVSSARPAVNSGSLSNLNVGGGYTALVQFDLSTLPSGTTAQQVSRATLRLYCNRADTPGLVSLAMVGGGWIESGVTYASMPASGAVLGSATVAEGSFVTFDVTAAVQAWLSGGASNNGFALSAANAVVQFDSKENDQTAHAPALEIALASATAAGAVGATGATGVTGAQGLQGPQGATGPQGVQGVQGPAGAVGATGSAGAKGATGATGVQGATGSTGAAGVTGPQGPAGLAGANGSVGATGATGVMGLQGPAGLTGAVGATGSVGPTGAAGFVYQGAYASTTNYALGDVVLWAGSSYVSLIAGNHGNTPSLSPTMWAVMASVGPMGATGLQGPTGLTGSTGALGPVGPAGEKGDQGLQGVAGQAGAQGIAGVAGPTGPQGVVGATGAAGPVGMSFAGVYDSTKNYAVGSGVLWQGAGWVSLTDNNHGNTPDSSPQMWALFAAAGQNGVAGVAGPTGATGSAGLSGAPGAAGATGATGSTGATGAAGLVYRGSYASGTNYALGDVVLWSGSSYASLVENNHGNTPDASPSMWGVLAAIGGVGPQGVAGGTGSTGLQGVQGVAGPQGVQGVQGPTGPQGPAGAQGLQGAAGAQGSQGATGTQGVAGQAGAQGVQGVAGPTGATGATGVAGAAGSVGMSFRGAYESAGNYALGDGVLWQGAGYVSLVAGNHGNAPDASPTFWSMFSSPGATGAAGAAGPTGAQGLVGPQGLQGATGTQGVQGMIGPTGLSGVQGATGPAGPTGAAGMNFRSGWNALTYYSTNDAVTWSGSTWLALTANSNQQPDASPQSWTVLAQAGGAGPTGAAGAAATVTVHTTTTLPAGSVATVTNSGTAQAVVLEFGIPQGAAGSSAVGGGSTSSGSFAAVYHAVNYATLYYSVNMTNAALTETSGAVLTWVPLGCTATKLYVSSLQTGAITVTLRSGGSATSMADTALSCTPSTSGSCPASGSVTIPAGNFIDLRIDGASSTVAGVWTALACQ